MRTSGLLCIGLAATLCAGPALAQRQRGSATAEPPAATLPDVTVIAPRPWPPQGTREEVVLPAYGNSGIAHPTRRAAFNVGWAFGLRSNLAGNPAGAAQALMEMEFLSVETFTNPDHVQGRGSLLNLFLRAKPEWRAVLGIPAAAPTQLVIDGLRSVMEPLSAGSGPEGLAALQPDVFPLGPAETWNRLNALPSLPKSNFAAVEVHRLMRRPHQY